MYRAREQTVAFHLTQGLRQHLLADAADQLADAGETLFAMFRQHLQNQHGPLVGHASDQLRDKHLQTRIYFRRWRLGGIVKSPGNQLTGGGRDLHGETLLLVTLSLHSAYFLKESVVHILGLNGLL